MKIYRLHHDNQISNNEFYSTRELARQSLKQKRDVIKYKAFPIAHIVTDNEDRFEFYFGYEEHYMTWRISEIDVIEKI